MNFMRPWTRIVIPCPANTVSGGPEALHQLAAALSDRGIDASLFYYPASPSGQPVPAAYQHYGVKVTTELHDDPLLLIIVCEVITSVVWQFPMAQKAIWWLSIDNFFKWQHINPGPSVLEPRPDIIHLCQSEYARQYLTSRGIAPLMMLTDYITEGTFSHAPAAMRVPCVTYNPKKGMDISRRLMDCGKPRHIWMPLDGLDKATLASMMQQARLYVDFGHHPGRDRIPREAALCGALVVTGRRGSAGIDSDIPLPNRFRLDERASDFEERATSLIDEMLRSDHAFSEAVQEQASYRAWIGTQKTTFLAEVDALIRANPAMSIAA